jgi:hypothetical protein
MNTEELLTKTIGTKEVKKLEAKDVIVEHAEIQEKGEKKTPILILSVKHPDQAELLELSKIQLIDGKIIKTVGLWVSLDEDNNIQKNSAIAKLMNFYKISSLIELKDKALHTTFDEKNYLVVKGY